MTQWSTGLTDREVSDFMSTPAAGGSSGGFTCAPPPLLTHPLAGLCGLADIPLDADETDELEQQVDGDENDEVVGAQAAGATPDEGAAAATAGLAQDIACDIIEIRAALAVGGGGIGRVGCYGNRDKAENNEPAEQQQKQQKQQQQPQPQPPQQQRSGGSPVRIWTFPTSPAIDSDDSGAASPTSASSGEEEAASSEAVSSSSSTNTTGSNRFRGGGGGGGGANRDSGKRSGGGRLEGGRRYLTSLLTGDRQRGRYRRVPLQCGPDDAVRKSEAAEPGDGGSSRQPASASTADCYDSDGDTDGLLKKPYCREVRLHIPELRRQQTCSGSAGSAMTSSTSSSTSAAGSEPRILQSANTAQGGAQQQPKKQQESNDQADGSSGEVLIEGLLFRALYLGSTQLVTEGQPGKAARMTQAQEAVNRVKAPDGEQQPCVPVDLFISKEKILVLNANLQEIMMDHALKTVAYIADIGNLLVFMARRRLLHSPEKKQARVVCHVFETDEAGLVAQSIGQAFQSAYLEFLRANGVDRPHRRELREAAYQDVLEAQDLLGEELALFSRPETQKEVLVPKAKGEPLGVVVVESGWGSLLPTAVLANMQPAGPAARCAQLNIGDQLLAVNGVSLVGLPLSTCQQLLKACRPRTAVKLSLVSCPPVVQVLIRRPDAKYQLGFSVQNGVICSLLRGGIAERGGVRVGHRIIEINGQSVVATPHDKIVSMLASGVGEIHMKTMPTSVFRLLTGQETPHYI
ncbi:hypothetical protein BOX15_Mlig003823g1 [Macrostomum lignano]|uniref:Uncharacterized protein n=1 Tax=Macrostomum lignano TaxID=282301 RepID=A0A267DPP9_9PLAT|nr:hypothetical protein BOX15_Mlig003823g1 [Macrostomum lignano]